MGNSCCSTGGQDSKTEIMAMNYQDVMLDGVKYDARFIARLVRVQALFRGRRDRMRIDLMKRQMQVHHFGTMRAQFNDQEQGYDNVSVQVSKTFFFKDSTVNDIIVTL